MEVVNILVSCSIKKNMSAKEKFEEMRSTKLKELQKTLKQKDYLKAKAIIWDISLISQCLDEPEFSIFVGKSKIKLVSNGKKSNGGVSRF
ncbi:MAG: hypothetical protein ACFFCS_02995 [Candidatus Hodarchaeota archaeon]